MKCDHFLAALETGGFVERMQARRHAARCPRCAAVRRAGSRETAIEDVRAAFSPCQAIVASGGR